MEDHQPTTEHVKEEVVDMEPVEVSQDLHQLCTACLCATRTTHTLDDGALKQYYMHILTEMQPEGGVVVLQSPRVCWECASHLKRAVRFREQVQDSYRLLQPMLLTEDKEDLDEFLQSSVSRPGRLKTCVAHSIDISPQGDDMLVMTVTEHDDNNDDEAALGSLENGTERRSSTFQENDVSVIEEPSEAFCDEKYHVFVSEDIVESPPMSPMYYKLDNYKDHDRNDEQLDVSDAYLGKEVFNHIITIKTLNYSCVSTGNVNTSFVCDYCYKGFTSKEALERHIATNKIYPHNNKTVPSPCEDCAVVLCSEVQKQTEIAEKHVLSDECNKSFSVKANIPRRKKVHSGENRFKCEVCHKSFSRNYNFRRHISIHDDENPYKCDACHKSFVHRSLLLKHLKVHAGEKHQCEVCHKSFTRKSYLKGHKRTHTGEKPFRCEVCNKSFAQRSNFNMHMRTHTGDKRFQCKVCNKAFVNKSNLNMHTRIHTGDKRHQCEVCNKSFSQKSNLKIHKKMHTGEKTFSV